MSKVLKVENGNYTVKVKAGGQIVLDTARGTLADGKPTGTVVIRGGLEVEGAITTIESTDTFIQDNVITLNAGETSNGISAIKNFESGIKIDRGLLEPAKLVFNETLGWTLGPLSGLGTFVFALESSNTILPIATNGIRSNGNLYLDTGNGIISVTNTLDYEEKIFHYDNSGQIYNPGTGVVISNDTIPNTKALVDYFDYALNNQGTSIIVEADTKVECLDADFTGISSRIAVTVDNTLTASFYTDRVEFESIKIQGNKISTTESNADLEIDAPGSGSVIINDILQINTTPGVDDITIDPFLSVDGIKLYSKDEYSGKTGLFFVNKHNNRDELVSKNRALLFGMLF